MLAERFRARPDMSLFVHRYGAAMAVGMACAGTGIKEAVSLLEPMMSDPTDFVRQVSRPISDAETSILFRWRKPTHLSQFDRPWLYHEGSKTRLHVPSRVDLTSSLVASSTASLL